MQNMETRVLLVEDEELARKTLAFYLNTIFDLFAQMDANGQQLDFPVVYAAARDGYAK